MRKFLTSVIVFLLLVAALIFVVKHWVIKTAVETAITAITGFETRIGKLQVDLPARIWVQDLKIDNPRGFNEKVFVSIPEFFIDLSLSEWLRRERIHVRELRLSIAEVSIEKNKMGVSNIALLTSVGGKAGGGNKPTPPPQKTQMPFYLDRFVLTMREARYTDNSFLVPVNMAVDMKVDQQVFEGISDPNALVQLIVLKILSVSTFGNLGLNPAMLQNSLNGAMTAGQDLLKQGTAAINQAVTSMPQEASALVGAQAQTALKETTQEAAAVVGKTAGAAKKKLSGLVGKLKTKVVPVEPMSETSTLTSTTTSTSTSTT